jgi:hypothetical protein
MASGYAFRSPHAGVVCKAYTADPNIFIYIHNILIYHCIYGIFESGYIRIFLTVLKHKVLIFTLLAIQAGIIRGPGMAAAERRPRP